MAQTMTAATPRHSATSAAAGLFRPWPVAALAAAHALLHLVTAGNYGVFRDEFYYLACADHLDWGYVDHPPLSIAVLAAVRAAFGESIVAIRLVPALLGGLLVLLAGGLARELGGGRTAQTLAALSVAIVPQYLAITGFFSMNAFDLVLWAVLALLLVRIVRDDDARWWLPFGVVAGLGLLNKVSVLFFGFGLALAIALTPLRGHLRRPPLWLGLLAAAVLFAPHLLWQVRHDWPTVEFVSNAARYKIADLGPWQFAAAQVLEIHPFNLPIWLAGLGYLLFHREGRRYRPLGILYLAVFALLALQKSKPYYLGPAYTMLLAAGGVVLERAFRGRPRLAVAAGAALVLGGMVTAPFAVPLLPPEAFIAYQRGLGISPPSAENHRQGVLPQHWADHFGWKEMTATVHAVYQALPAEERAKALIVTSNYGEAGALNHYGRRLGLPRVVSQHNSFYLWGPGPVDLSTVVITVGIPAAALRETFETVQPVARLTSPYAMPFETAHPILVCRGWKMPPAEAWRRGKRYI